jgi:2'-5' RNA ligase
MTQIASSDFSRLFIALWPDRATRMALDACREPWIWPKHAHLAHTDSLHVTLHFLGNIPHQIIPTLIDALRLPFTQFDLTLNRQQIWSNGVAVLEPETIPTQLTALHDELRAVLQSLSIPVEVRPYRPHVTFARHVGDAISPPDCKPIQWQVQGYALVQSELTPPRGYRVLQSYC